MACGTCALLFQLVDTGVQTGRIVRCSVGCPAGRFSCVPSSAPSATSDCLNPQCSSGAEPVTAGVPSRMTSCGAEGLFDGGRCCEEQGVVSSIESLDRQMCTARRCRVPAEKPHAESVGSGGCDGHVSGDPSPSLGHDSSIRRRVDRRKSADTGTACCPEAQPCRVSCLDGRGSDVLATCPGQRSGVDDVGHFRPAQFSWASAIGEASW